MKHFIPKIRQTQEKQIMNETIEHFIERYYATKSLYDHVPESMATGDYFMTSLEINMNAFLVSQNIENLADVIAIGDVLKQIIFLFALRNGICTKQMTDTK